MREARRIIFYLLQFWLHVGYRLYFRRVILIDRHKVPDERPVILAPNHQNSFFDAMMSAIFVPQRFTFLARADVFRHKWFRKIMYLVSCLPAYRSKDGFSKVRDNEATFEQCQQLLDSDESILIFPEGNQEFGYRLRPLKKGLARIALEYTRRTGENIPVIPVGMHFEDYRAFDKRLVVAFGSPVYSLNFLKTFEENPSLGLRRFTEELRSEMDGLCVSNDDPDQKDKINRYIFSEDSYPNAEDWRKRVTAINDGVYLNDQLAIRPERKNYWHLLGTPVALAAFLIFIIPYLLLRWVTNLLSPDIYFAPSVEFVLFLTIFPWYIFFLSVAAGIISGSFLAGLLFFAAAPLAGKYFLAWRRGVCH